jgi:DNA-binding response OmpR family regulator
MTTGNKRILCVDGIEDNNFTESALLRAAGFEVESAKGIADALRITRHESFDLYLVAYRQQDGTGLELCRKIRRFDSTTPILFFSARVYESDRRAALEAGATTFLRKPEDITRLVVAAAELITSGQKTLSFRTRSRKHDNRDLPGDEDC